MPPNIKRYIFPVLLLGLNLGSAITAFAAKDWRKSIYFLASAVCIATAGLI